MIFVSKFVDPKTGVEKKIIVSVDDGIRPNTNIVDLAKLKPAFHKDGTTTAGIKELSFVNFVTLGEIFYLVNIIVFNLLFQFQGMLAKLVMVQELCSS